MSAGSYAFDADHSLTASDPISIAVPAIFSTAASVNNGHSRHDFLDKGILTLPDFTAPTMGTNGNEKRNLFRNPGYLNLDSSMIKNNKLPFWWERVNLQIKFEFFNVLNRVNLGGVDANMFDSTFGKSTWTRDPRTIQLGARLTF